MIIAKFWCAASGKLNCTQRYTSVSCIQVKCPVRLVMHGYMHNLQSKPRSTTPAHDQRNTQLAMNLLRILGQHTLHESDNPLRNAALCRRIKTVM
ncbi:MAG: hypothetical protein DDT26_01405 [Dehalococcoidia bacterium]|nr:hypothetical protein [Chloroflexota bacterium]